MKLSRREFIKVSATATAVAIAPKVFSEIPDPVEEKHLGYIIF